ncbi:MAG: sensor histidine kinase, partial [Actinomycetota bacterium]
SEEPSDVAEFGDVARRIGRMVGEGLVLPERTIDIKVTGATGPLSAELATPLAVTLTELLQNAVEHAFPDARSGTIGVELGREGDEVVLAVWDDGVGMRQDPFDPELEGASGTRLGLQIVRSLIEEMGGRFDFVPGGGTRVELRVRAVRAPSG